MSEDIVGSKLKAQNNYGQGGYAGPSSVPMSNQPSASASLKPKNHADVVADVKAANVATFNEADRKHQQGNVPVTYGAKDRTAGNIASVPSKNDRSKG